VASQHRIVMAMGIRVLHRCADASETLHPHARARTATTETIVPFGSGGFVVHYPLSTLRARSGRRLRFRLNARKRPVVDPASADGLARLGLLARFCGEW
jgi:hypothetical protein